jgi:hypothetical protein
MECLNTLLPVTCPSHCLCVSQPVSTSLSLLSTGLTMAMLGSEHSPGEEDDDDKTEESRSRSRTKGEKKKDRKRRKRQEEEEEAGATEINKKEENTKADPKKTAADKRKISSLAASPVAKSSASASVPAMLGEEDLATAASKGKGKGGKSKEKNEKEKIEGKGGWTRDQKKLMVLVMKQVLQTQQQSRELASIVLDPFLCPAESVICVEAEKQGKRYAKAVASPGHGLQAPHLYIFGAILSAIAKMADASEEEKNCYAVYEQLTLIQRGEVIKVCKLAKVYKETHKKLVFAWGVGQQTQLLRTLVVQKLSSLEGWQLKQGKAPAGHLEREISLWLTDMLS